MTCPTCLDNCDPLVTDKCTKYTGPNIDALGVCTGMSLFEIESIIFGKLSTIATAADVKLSTLTTTCAFVTDLLFGKPAQPFSIQEFAEIVLEGFCKLNTKVIDLEEINTPFSFNTSCLEGDVSSKDKIIQALIVKSCVDGAKITALETSTVKQIDFCSQVKACLEDTEAPIVVPSTDFNTRMVPYTYIPYAGPLSNFDNTGKGLVAAGFDKIYLANGLNGTQDWRGRSPIGAVQNVPGTALDNVIDPTIPANSAYNHTLGGKAGASTTILSINQLPSFTPTINDPGHAHFTIINVGSPTKGATPNNPVAWSSNKANGNQDYDLCYVGGTANSGLTNKVSTGITVNSIGGSQAHSNLHPVIGCNFIVYLP